MIRQQNLGHSEPASAEPAQGLSSGLYDRGPYTAGSRSKPSSHATGPVAEQYCVWAAPPGHWGSGVAESAQMPFTHTLGQWTTLLTVGYPVVQETGKPLKQSLGSVPAHSSTGDFESEHTAC